MEGQSNPSFVPNVMRTNILLTDDLAQEDLLRRYRERIENLSQQDRLSKFCTDAGFLIAVEIGQYFMTQDTEEQWLVVSTLCQERKKHLNRKVGSEGTPKLGPCWNLQTVTCKVNMELISEFGLIEQRQYSQIGSEFLMA